MEEVEGVEQMDFMFTLEEVCECCGLGVSVALVCVYGPCFIFFLFTFFFLKTPTILEKLSVEQDAVIKKGQ